MAEKLEFQARACAALGSPFTAVLILAALSDYREGGPVEGLLDKHPEYRRPGLHLAGALHYLALSGEPTLSKHYPSVGGDGDATSAWAAARAMLARDPDPIERLFRREVQTNEPARSMPILGALLSVAATFDLPLRIFEIGASAGLNLRFDRYRYEGNDWHWGDIDSALVLRNRTERGRPKHLLANLEIVERRGCDLSPIDVTVEGAGLNLQSFVWPDQAERLERLRAAIEVANHLPVTIDAESLYTWLPREAKCRAGYVTVIVHTLVEEHLSASEKAELDEMVLANAEQASPTAPLARVSMELTGRTYRTAVAAWSDSSAVTEICTSDGHAQGIVWV
jgi:hypothetical protein